MTAALALSGVTIAYGGAVVLHGVSLAVAPGEIVAVVGGSGSGKTSIALAAAGLLPAGAACTGGIAAAGGIGIVFQDPLAALNPALTIGRQIGENFRGARRDRAAAVAAAMTRVGLDVPPDRHPHALSGGQRQRAMLAMALIAGPAVLIADEPTAALDTLARAGIAALIAGIARTDGAGVLLITHDLTLAAAIADRVVALEGGRVVEQVAARGLGAAVSPALAGQVAAAWYGAGPGAGTRPSAGPAILRLSGISHPFGEGQGSAGPVGLRDVALAIGHGEAVGLIGGSGAGKSTLARIALGLVRPAAGHVTTDGADRPSVQAVFQDPLASFDPRWTIARIVAEPLARSEVGRIERQARIAAALAAVDLSPALADRRPQALSGGQQQRVALARALVIDPALVVLDEALSALDPRLRAEMVALLRRLQRTRGLAYLLIGHDLAVMRAAVDRLVVLEAGRIVEEGPTVSLLAHPAAPATAALVAAAPSLDQALAGRAAS